MISRDRHAARVWAGAGLADPASRRGDRRPVRRVTVEGAPARAGLDPPAGGRGGLGHLLRRRMAASEADLPAAVRLGARPHGAPRRGPPRPALQGVREPGRPAELRPRLHPGRQPAGGEAGNEPHVAYAGASALALVLAGEGGDPGHDVHSEGEATAHHEPRRVLPGDERDRPGRAVGPCRQSSGAAVGQAWGSNVGRDDRAAGAAGRRVPAGLWAHHERPAAACAARPAVGGRDAARRPPAAGPAPPAVPGRWELSALLGGTAFELGDYPTAYAQLLTAWQLAQEVGDHALSLRSG